MFKLLLLLLPLPALACSCFWLMQLAGLVLAAMAGVAPVAPVARWPVCSLQCSNI